MAARSPAMATSEMSIASTANPRPARYAALRPSLEPRQRLLTGPCAALNSPERSLSIGSWCGPLTVNRGDVSDTSHVNTLTIRESMRRAIPLSLIGALMTCAAIGAQAASASPFGSAVVGHVYVNDNTPTTNTIAGFARTADGGLTPLPGSPFATGGAGNGAGTGSAGALQETDNGRY